MSNSSLIVILTVEGFLTEYMPVEVNLKYLDIFPNVNTVLAMKNTLGPEVVISIAIKAGCLFSWVSLNSVLFLADSKFETLFQIN